MSAKPILIADDNPDDVAALLRVFRKWHIKHPLQVVASAEEAICYFKGEGIFADRDRYPLPVLFLLDLVMPGIGGVGVLKWLKAKPEPDFPIIVLTGMQNLKQMAEAYQLGAQSFLMKPIEESEFRVLISAFKEIEVES